MRSAILSAALFAISLGAAEASDIWVPAEGSIKDGGLRGTLVPQPVAIPETKFWYVRGDVGTIVSTSSDITLRGGFGQVRDPESSYVLSLGAGKYLSPNWRGEVTFDYRDSDNVFASTNERVSFAGHTGLVNVYYDFRDGGSFRPYVGAGIGLSLYRTERDLYDPQSGEETKDSTNTYGFATALMAGFAYEFDTGLWLDTNYRYVWQNNEATVDLEDCGCQSTVEIDSRHDHELRVGLRYDVW